MSSASLETLLDGQAEALTQKAIDLALAGDMAALRLCLDRILPPRKDRPVSIEMPTIDTAEDKKAQARHSWRPSPPAALRQFLRVNYRLEKEGPFDPGEMILSGSIP